MGVKSFLLPKNPLAFLGFENMKITHITVSVGVATQTPASQDAIKEMIMRADSALYQAKGNGRNQVSLYGEEYERTRKEIG